MDNKSLKLIVVGIAITVAIILCGKLLFSGKSESRCYTPKEVNDSLIIYPPQYTNIDLVCGTMPSVGEQKVIFCAEAAFTGELLKEFKHSNIAGDHVSGGIRYKGYECPRNTGAFIFYKGHYKFIYQNYSAELDEAAKNGGMGFTQEAMIHNSHKVPCTRKDSNTNEFRALCDLNGQLCVIDSNGVSKFGDFIQNLIDIGVSEALYLDMGKGWNYSWYRDKFGDVNEIHKDRIIYTTNWITFYNE